MIIARAIQGIGGGVLPLAFGIVRDEFPAEKVAGVVGILAGVTAAGGGLGTVIAGPIVSVLDYHWLFWIPMIVLLLAAVAAHLVVPRSDSRLPGKVNWLAVAALSGWLIALLLAVSEAPVWGWGSSKVIGLMLVAVAVCLGWIVVETRSEHPLIDMTMMRIPVVWTTNLVAFLFGVGLYATSAFVPEFSQTPSSAGYGFGASVTHSGLLMLPMGGIMFALSFAAGPLTGRFGGKALLLSGSIASIGTFVMLTLFHAHEWQLLVAMSFQGIGFGLAFAAMSSLVVEGVPASQTGVASGMNANIRTIGGSIGAAVVSTVITASAHGNGRPTNAGYTHGFGVLAIATVAAAFAAVLVPSVRRSLTDSERRQSMPHAELGIVAAGTLVGADPE
jgi:MFS family permease